MADKWTREQRSRVMSRNKGRGTKSTEIALKMRLVAAGIRGWHTCATGIFGKPDFVFANERLVIFVDGCFWHGCKTHRTIPETNKEFWEKKIGTTVQRDATVTARLTEEGWKVLRYWEHDIRERPSEVINEIKTVLDH